MHQMLCRREKSCCIHPKFVMSPLLSVNVQDWSTGFWEDVNISTHTHSHISRSLVTMVTAIPCQQSLLPPSIASPLSPPPLLSYNPRTGTRRGLLLPSCLAGGSRKKPGAAREQQSGRRCRENRLMADAEVPAREVWPMLPPACIRAAPFLWVSPPS